MRGSALCLSVILLSAAPLAALEQEDFLLNDAADLAALCGASDEPLALQMCHGYVAGVDQAHSAIKARLGRGVYCLPEDGSVSRASATASFLAWMAEHPELGSLTALNGLMTWAQSAYPCPAE